MIRKAAAGGMRPGPGSDPDSYRPIPLGADSDHRQSLRRANRHLRLVVAALAALAALVATWLYANTLREAERESLRTLQTFNTLRIDAIRDFFRNHANEARVWAENPTFRTRAAEIFADWDAMTPPERAALREHLVNGAPLAAPSPAQSRYLAHYRRLAPTLEAFIAQHNFYDLFLFNTRGELAYTVVREDDFGLDYADPDSANPDSANPYARSGLGMVAREAAESADADFAAVSDFEPYAPSGGSIEAFIAEPMFGEGGERLGVLAIQLSFAELNSILDYSSGLRESGRTLLVGTDGRIRNDLSTLEPGADATLDTEAVQTALAGGNYVGESRGERGQPILASAQPLDVGSLRWAVVTEVDRAQTREPLRIYLWVWLASLTLIAATALAMYQILKLRR